MALIARRSLIIVLLLATVVPSPHLAAILLTQVPPLTVAASPKVPHARGSHRITNEVFPRACQAGAPQMSGHQRQPRVSNLDSTRTPSSRPFNRDTLAAPRSPALVYLRC